MRFLEYIVYESKPFLYAGLGVFSCSNHDSRLLILSGIVLIGCSLLILKMRFNHRLKKSM